MLEVLVKHSSKNNVRSIHITLSCQRGCDLHLRILAAGYPQEEHVLFWMWNDLLPQRLQSVCVLLWRFPAVSQVHQLWRAREHICRQE